jgi:DamX protein
MARKKSINNIPGNCHLNQQTLDYLKLSKQPFGKEILSSQTFYSDASLEKIVSNIRHQAQFSDLLLLVEGPHGSGKTSLFRHLLQSDTPNIKLLPVQAEPTDTLAHLQQKAALHLEDMGSSAQLEESLNNLQTFDQIALLAIDDSHVLSDSTLQALFAYQQQLQQQGITLKILFFANTGLSQTLQKIIEITEDQMYVQTLPQYHAKQAAHFINFKLQCAGYRGEPLLTSKDLQQLDKKINGSALNLMHHTAQLLEKQVKKKTAAPLSGWIKILLVALLLLIVTIAVAIYFDIARFTEKSPGNSSTELAPLITEPEVIAQQASSPKASNDQADTETPVENSQTQHAVEQPPIETERVDSSATETRQPTTIQRTDEATQNTTAQTPAPLTTSTRDTSDTTTNTTASSTVSKVTDSNKQPAQTVSITETTTDKADIAKQKPQPAKPAVAKLPAPLLQLRAMGLREADWLLAQNASRWTIQLLGAREPETLLVFAQRHQLGEQAAWYKTWLSSKPYYVLVYGSYASRDAARAQINQLPDRLRSAKPWVKSLDSVQKTIK